MRLPASVGRVHNIQHPLAVMAEIMRLSGGRRRSLADHAERRLDAAPFSRRRTADALGMESSGRDGHNCLCG